MTGTQRNRRTYTKMSTNYFQGVGLWGAILLSSKRQIPPPGTCPRPNGGFLGSIPAPPFTMPPQVHLSLVLPFCAPPVAVSATGEGMDTPCAPSTPHHTGLGIPRYHTHLMPARGSQSSE